jgi:DNA-binding response OmpR family regulator
MDLVVTNNRMPLKSGAELVSRLREQYPALPILHLDDLSLSDPTDIPADVPNLNKPFQLNVFLRRIQELLEAHSQCEYRSALTRAGPSQPQGWGLG